jgi:outer membrane immunogenic protein
MTGAFVLKPSVHTAKIRPYLLAGPGALRFSPTSDAGNLAGALSQTKAAFLYGGGADFAMASHVGIRADYRGFLTRTPDFTLSSLTIGSTTHLAQPSVGIFFRF